MNTCADKDTARWLKFKIRAKVKRVQQPHAADLLPAVFSTIFCLPNWFLVGVCRADSQAADAEALGREVVNC
jgi:hypothetical protein